MILLSLFVSAVVSRALLGRPSPPPVALPPPRLPSPLGVVSGLGLLVVTTVPTTMEIPVLAQPVVAGVQGSPEWKVQREFLLFL